MKLEKLRKEIDMIDAEILQLLNKRMETTLVAKKLKEKTEDKKREDEVLERIKKKANGVLGQKFSEDLFRRIINESKELQNKEMKLIGFQGEHGAYSEVAAREFDKSSVSIAQHEFADVFDAVTADELDFGIVPVENSLVGSIDQVNNLFIETELRVVGEIKLPIHHCLLSLPDTDYKDIKVVYSHPAALGQCRGIIERNKLEAKPYYDTAGAALMLTRSRPAGAAVIASKLCAELYDLEIIKENIEDNKKNTTRFLVLAKHGVDNGNKCSIIFSTVHKAGALFRVLKAFSDVGINLTRIESMPILDDPGNYAFLLDFQGSDKDKKVIETLEKVKQETVMFKFLGCYKEAKEAKK